MWAPSWDQQKGVWSLAAAQLCVQGSSADSPAPGDSPDAHACVHAQAHAHPCTHRHSCTHVHICARTHWHVHTQIHTSHTHTHTWASRSAGGQAVCQRNSRHRGPLFRNPAWHTPMQQWHVSPRVPGALKGSHNPHRVLAVPSWCPEGTRQSGARPRGHRDSGPRPAPVPRWEGSTAPPTTVLCRAGTGRKVQEYLFSQGHWSACQTASLCLSTRPSTGW